MARISEIHYSNAVANNTGTAEFLEVALEASEEANESDYVVSFYEADGSLILELALDDPRVSKSFDASSNEWVYVISQAETGVYLTDPDGNQADNAEAFSLTNTGPNPNEVVDFYDVGGGTQNIQATGGAAQGATSENIDLDGESPNTIGGSIQFNEPDETVFEVAALTEGTSGVVCFTEGTLIKTPKGEVPVEQLTEQDLVCTVDKGVMPILWISSRKVVGDGRLAPILFKEGSIGNDQDLLVSPEHRILISDWRAELLFGQPEMLIAAKSLVNGETICRCRKSSVRYFHFSLESHELVYANGAAAETFLPTEHSLDTLGTSARAEFLEIFPEFNCMKWDWPLCRDELRPFEANLIQ